MPDMVGRQTWALRICRVAVAAVLLLGLAAQAGIDEPFGLRTAPLPEGRMAAMWQALQSEMELERPVVARCRAEPDKCNSPAALRFLAIVKKGDGYDGLVRVMHINRAVNLSIRAINTAVPGYNVSNWTSPLTTLTTGAGDCKQYAVLKYAALSDAGYKADDLRIVIVQIKSQQIAHAVAAVRHAGRWMILDNRTLEVVNSNELRNYMPLLLLDHRGVREYVRPSAPGVAGVPCDTAVG
jgi:predicted transglutaminase-like cysteine proteinase